MKKIFTLLFATFVAVCASAQVISFGEADVASAGQLVDKKFEKDGFVLALSDNGTKDGAPNPKMAIDKNSGNFGTSAEDKISFTHRLKSGATSSDANFMTLTIPADGTLKIYARTGSNSATDRNVLVKNEEGAEIINKIVKEDDAFVEKYTDSEGNEKSRNIYPIITGEVKAGTYTVTYPVGSINFYAFELVTAGGETSIKNISATSGSKIYDLNGRQLNAAPTSGVYVQGGKKYIAK